MHKNIVKFVGWLNVVMKKKCYGTLPVLRCLWSCFITFYHRCVYDWL